MKLEDEVEIVSVVLSIDFNLELDLRHLYESLDAQDVEYNPEVNHWLKTRFGPEDTYVAFYQSGKAMIAGADSVTEAEELADRVVEETRKAVDSVDESNRRIENIVCTYSLDRRVSLEKLAVAIGFENMEYEPEQFPALVYRKEDYVILVFASGKIVVTGLTDIDEIATAVADFAACIQEININSDSY